MQTDLTGPRPILLDNGLQVNAASTTGHLSSGKRCCCTLALRRIDERNDCYGSVIKHSDQSHDGIREIQFDATMLHSRELHPVLHRAVHHQYDSELYDVLHRHVVQPPLPLRQQPARATTTSFITVNYNGNEYLIEFAYSTDWQYNVSDWAMVLTKSYMVYRPERLRRAGLSPPCTLATTIRNCARRMQLDSIATEASIRTFDLVDPYKHAVFSDFATKRGVNSMTHRTYLLPLMLVVLLLLSLTACGDSSSDDRKAAMRPSWTWNFSTGCGASTGTSRLLL